MQIVAAVTPTYITSKVGTERVAQTGAKEGERHCDTSRESRCSTYTILHDALRIRQRVI